MVAISLDHAIGFFVKHAFHRSARADFVPHPGLWLQVESDLIRRFEGCFGWTPGMKAHVVQAPLLARLEQRQPRFDIGRWVTCQREIAAAMRTAKDDGCAIEDELLSLGAELAQPYLQFFVLIHPGALQPQP